MKYHNPIAPSTLLGVLLVLAGCSGSRITPAELAARPGIRPALDTIDGSIIARHVDVLASDSFEGRRPGTHGEDLTLDYITGELASYGFEPVFDDGFLQPFSFGAYNIEISGTLGPVVLVQGENIVAAPWPDATVEFADAPVVFGGYGMVSEEHGRNDYEGIDLTGAVVVVLGGAPPGQDDLRSIGRYTAKAVNIAERGGAAMIVVWGTDNYSWADTRWYYDSPFFNQSPADVLPVLESGEALFDQVLAPRGLSLGQASQEAALPAFRALTLPWPLNGSLSTQRLPLVSNNVVAQISGTDPDLADEWIVLTAHWDHLGQDTLLSGDQIYNGAMDNAIGTATLLEIARAAAGIQKGPRRGLRFVWTGAEEFGFHGARAYVSNPIHPLDRTIAAINLDFQNPFGRAHDLIIIGPGNSTIEDVLTDVAHWQGRVIGGDAWEEHNFFEGSDQFAFAEAGIPAVFPASGVDLIDGGRDRGLSVNKDYEVEDYHQVSDEDRETWDYAGVEEDAEAILILALLIAEETTPPEWKTTTNYPEFARLHQTSNEK